MKLEKIKKNLSIILLLLAIAGCMFILNISTLLSPDDYSYANTIAGEDLKITSVSEIYSGAKYLYYNWTGRLIPHILIGIFMTTSTFVFKIFNVLLFIVLLIYISKFITKKVTFLSLLTAFGFLIYGKMFGEKFLWISGSLNYLWTTVPLILFLYTIYEYFVEEKEIKKWQKIAIFLSSYLIGFSHEVISFVGGSFLGMVFLVNVKKMWKNSKKKLGFLILITALFGIGSLCTILAPGNVARSTLDTTENGGIFACLGNYYDIKWQLIILAVSMILIRFFDEKKLFKNEILYFLMPCAIATLPFAYLGYFTPRSFVPYEVLLIGATCANIQYLESRFVNYRKTLIGVSIFASIIVSIHTLPNVYSAGRYILPYKIKTMKQLETASKNGEKDVIISKFLFTDKIHMEDLINIYNFFIDTNNTAVTNVYASLYYKFNCLRAISDIDYLIEIETDIEENVDYGIINKDTLELISIVSGSNKIVFTIPKEQYGIYVIDCRDKPNFKEHVKSIRIRSVQDEVENCTIEKITN